jgi:HEAT repeat protein
MEWLFTLSPVPAAAFADEDWLVRWSAIKADATAKHITVAQRLGHVIEAAVDDQLVTACLTAVMAAGSRLSTRETLLAGEPKALAACRAVDDAVYEQGTRDLFHADRNRAHETLQYLSAGRGTGPARLVLDLLGRLPSDRDETLADILVLHAERGGPPVGLAILREAAKSDASRVDRLLKVYSALRDRNRPLLGSSSKDARAQAIAALAPIAPLSLSELRIGLSDSQASIRMAAARAISRGEGHTVTEAAEARLSGSTPADASEKRQWLALLADVDDPRCPALTRRTWEDETQPDAVRAAALVSLAGCARKDSVPDLVRASSAKNVTIQAGVMRAVLMLPREPGVVSLVEGALTSSTDEVLAGAAQAIGAHRLTGLALSLVPLIDHRSATVRAEALRAFWALDHRKAQAKVISKLGHDSSVDVRLAAATLLGEVGGPQAVSALAQASKTDGDGRVKMAATESLRRLGVTR